MAASALRAYREAFRQLEVRTDKHLRELPSFRGELMKAKDYKAIQDLRVEDTEIDWGTIHRQLPHYTQAINAVQKFYEARKEAIMSAPEVITPKVHQAVMEKLKEAVRNLCLPFLDLPLLLPLLLFHLTVYSSFILPFHWRSIVWILV